MQSGQVNRDTSVRVILILKIHQAEVGCVGLARAHNDDTSALVRATSVLIRVTSALVRATSALVSAAIVLARATNAFVSATCALVC